MLANEPIEKAEANEATLPIDRIDPIDPIDRIDPFDPMLRIEPSERIDKIDLGGPSTIFFMAK